MRNTTVPPPRLLTAVLVLAVVIGGGGWALASGSGGEIRGCVEVHKRFLLIANRCGIGQTPLVFAGRGPAGPRGRTGAAGKNGTPAIDAWADVGTTGACTGSACIAGGHGLSVTRVATGTYHVTVTASSCHLSGLQSLAPVVTPANDTYPPTGGAAGSFPVAWTSGVTGPSSNQFDVFIGLVTAGTFALTDHDFDVQVPCS